VASEATPNNIIKKFMERMGRMQAFPCRQKSFSLLNVKANAKINWRNLHKIFSIYGFALGDDQAKKMFQLFDAGQ
jgi:hypothetical protein